MCYQPKGLPTQSVLMQNTHFQNGNSLDFSGKLAAPYAGDRAAIRLHDTCMTTDRLSSYGAQQIKER